MTAPDKVREGWPRWRSRVALAAFAGVAVWFWVFLGGGYPSNLHRAAEMGSAFGPIATFATAAALFVGFESLRLQREIVAEQGKALEEQQRAMTDALRQLSRAADAQQNLAAAQEDAAAALRRTEQATRRSTIAALTVGIAATETGRAQAPQHLGVPPGNVASRIDKLLKDMSGQIESEERTLASENDSERG